MIVELTSRPIFAIFRRALAFGVAAGPRDEGADLFFVLADLDPVIIDDDRPTQNARISPNKLNQLRNRHRIEIDMVLLHDFAAGRNDIVRAVFGLLKDFLQIGDA